MKKILVTGGAGYVGSVATYLLLQKGFVDNLTTGHKGPLDFFEKKFGSKKFRYYKADLREPLDKIFKKETCLRRQESIDAVLHYAASCLVNESMENPQKYFSNNVCGTQNLLSTILKFGIKNIVFSSTCAVYGETEYVPVDEKHPTNPANPYGLSKRMIEQMIEWYGKLTGLNYVILRYFNVCGASDDGEIGDSKKPSVLLMQNAVRGALGIEPFYLTCPKVKTPDGTPIRDYINVVDLNEAHILALGYLMKGGHRPGEASPRVRDSQESGTGPEGKSEIINLGTGKGNSVLEIVNKVQRVCGVKFDLKKAKPRRGEYAEIFADNKKAKKILNWKPKRSIEDSVGSLVKWYKNHPHGWI
jgi:UDP-glucose 4-epimerase